MSNTSGRLAKLSVRRGNKAKTETAERCSHPARALRLLTVSRRPRTLSRGPNHIVLYFLYGTDCDAAVASVVRGSPNRWRDCCHTNKLSSTYRLRRNGPDLHFSCPCPSSAVGLIGLPMPGMPTLPCTFRHTALIPGLPAHC